MPSISKFVAGLLTTIFILVLSASPAWAHTGFGSSSPADGDLIDEPVSVINVTFVGEATPAGEGFVVLDSTGIVQVPDEVSSADNLTWVLRFDQPLAAGDIGVRWTVAAPDAHPISGSFSFTVAAETPVAADPSEEPLEVIDATEPAGVDPVDESTPNTTEGRVEETSELSEPAPSVTATAEPENDAGSVSSATSSDPVDLDSFLETGIAEPAGTNIAAAAARILSLLGAVLAIGGTAFAAFGLRGDPTDIHAVLYWIRRGGVLVAIGAVSEAVTMTVTLAGAWSALFSPVGLTNALWSSAGIAVGLRVAGGLLATSRITMATHAASAVGDPVVAARQLATVGGGHSAPPPRDRHLDEPFVYGQDHAWDYRGALGGLVGVAMVIVSFMFDGHTASEGPRAIHAIANLAHVTTATIWAGGVVMLAFTIRRRRIQNRPTKELQLAMRFSVIATIALIGAGTAGIALSAIVLDSVSEIWTTPWGRLLALKVALVATAATGGAYNHRVVLPALDQNPEHQLTIDRFRTVATFEAAALVAVSIVTAVLIAASSA